MNKVPHIDLGECTDCESCLEICPQVFIRNRETSMIEVAELPEYPQADVLEAIKMCPSDCISFEDIPCPGKGHDLEE